MPVTKSELKNPVPMLRFTIRDLLWLMVDEVDAAYGDLVLKLGALLTFSG
jgi:hypothetical protein